jgi:O-antigen ligase/tetratricopeptide (TPR) repeat protein
MADRPKKITLSDTIAQETQKSSKSTRGDREDKGGLGVFFAWVSRVCVLFVVCSSPWMIASVNPGAQLILAVVLLVGLACWWIDVGLSSGKRQVVPYVVLFVTLGMAIGFFQTIEFSSGIAGLFAGKQVEIAERFLDVSGAEGTSPIRLSLDVEGTWHQLRLLVIALSCLLLASRFFRGTKELGVLLTAVLVNGVALTAFGLVQKFQFNGKLFWEIELTQGGVPFGPFVCRNNAAGYLVMCVSAGAGLLLLLMTKKEATRPHQIVSTEIPLWRQVSTYIGIFVAQLDAKRLAIIISCVFISIGVVATLSRGGVVALLSAWIGGSVIYNMTRKPKFAGILMFPTAILVIGLASWVGFAGPVLSRFEKLDTLAEHSLDARLNTWRDTLPASLENGWFGTGLGSYRSAHRLYRTNTEKRLFEYAENQYVQSAVEAGVPGFCLLIAALWVAFWYVFYLLKRGNSGLSVGVGVFGAFLISGQTVAAIFDFGWYIPANMVLFATGVGVIGFHAQSLAVRHKKTSWLQVQCPPYLYQVVILSTFLFCIFAVYSLYNQSAVYGQVRPATLAMREPMTMDRAETEKRIESISPLMANVPTTSGLNMLGDLHVHRARLQYLELLKSESPTRDLDLETQKQVDQNLWNLTGLVRMHEYVSALARQKNYKLVRDFREQVFVQYDLPQALVYFRLSQQKAPLQPRTQLMIGLLSSIFRDFDKAQVELEKSIELSPQNADFRFSTALVLLQQGESGSAARHFAHYLKLRPKSFLDVMDLVTGKSNRQIEPLDNRLIFEQVVGEDPKSLYLFAKNYLSRDRQLKDQVLESANVRLTDVSLSDSEMLKLKADINFELGDTKTGIEFLDSTVRSNPNDQKTRLRLAQSLFQAKRFQEAREQVEKLLQVNSRSKAYNNLLKDIKTELKRLRDSKDLGMNSILDTGPLSNSRNREVTV